MELSVREANSSDIKLITDYWYNSSREHLEGMGVEVSKMNSRESLEENLTSQLAMPINQRNSYCIIWEVNGKPVGHCNCNPINFGSEAKMHLHLWHNDFRKRGIGLGLLKLTLPLFFNHLKLERLICEPYALNPAPNRTVEKAGFKLEREYTTVPGGFNFEQPVKRWVLLKNQLQNGLI